MSRNSERRNWLRWDKVFPVLVESPIHGFMNCIARNISCGGLFIETRAPLPLGSPLRVYFSLPDGHQGFSAEGKVKNHYFLNYGSSTGPQATMGMGVRFTEIDNDGQRELRKTLENARLLH